LLVPFALTLIANLGGVLVLYLSLRAVGQEPSPLVPLVGYVIGTTLALVAPVFGGIGVVEVTMALALQQAGVPGAAAVSATILFRLVDLWFPLLLGLTTQSVGHPVARQAGARILTSVERVWSYEPRLSPRAVAGIVAAGVLTAAPELFNVPARYGIELGTWLQPLLNLASVLPT
jgi:hypothetical protein